MPALTLTREQSIRATFEILKPTGVIEVRSMGDKTYSGYYKDREKLIRDILHRDDLTWYFVMNEIDSACYSREQSEKILKVTSKMKTTSDKDIQGIDWILIDADPVRAKGVSASDAEKEKAKECCGRIYQYLRKRGFCEPVICDSGNGYHLLYRVKIAVADAGEIQKFLQALDMLFSDSAVEVDTSVYNPSRITKVYGTIARKGASTQERPHRASGIISVPDEIGITSISSIKQVSAVLPKPEKQTYKNGYDNRFDLDAFIKQHGIAVHSDKVVAGTRKIILERCPFDENHKAPDPAIFVSADGAIGFHCFHNSCQGKRWQDVRQLFDPTCYEQNREQVRRITPKSDWTEPQKETTTGSAEHFLRLCDIEVLDRSQIVSIKTGISALDAKLIGMNKGELSIWSGGNGSGKSTMLSQIALETIERGFKCAMFSGELTNNRAKNWLLQQAAGRQNVYKSQDGVSYYVPKAKAKRIDEWAADKIWIYNNAYGSKVNSVIADFEAHMKTHETDVIIIDNLMSLDLTEIRADKYDRQTVLVLRLSELAKQYNVHVHFVCHPRKPTGFLRKSDISGTADLTNAADNVFMMHRVNQDFMKLAAEFLGNSAANKLKDFTNVIEIMKNRDLGVADEFVGLYFEPESKRMLNAQNENKVFGWEDGSIADTTEFQNVAFDFTPISQDDYDDDVSLPF